jgi:hypothetical protein
MAKFRLLNKTHWILQVNLVFVLVFLNIWDYVISRELFNAMILGIFIFGIPMVLWFWGSFRAVMLCTLVSILESVILVVFIMQAFELAGFSTGVSKSLFWFPYLLLAIFNALWGLRIYSKNKNKVEAELNVQ